MKKIIYLFLTISLLASCKQEVKKDELFTNREKLDSIISLNKLCINVEQLKWQEKNLSDENGIGPTDKILIATFKTDTVFGKLVLKNNKSNPDLINEWMPVSVKRALNGSEESYYRILDSLIIDYYNFGYLIYTQEKYAFLYLSKINK